MDTTRVEAAYDRLLASIGDRADAIGDRPVVTHWPHVGSAYRGLAIVGQAVWGWDDDRHAGDLRSLTVRQQLIADVRGRAEVPEPIGWIDGHAREGTPFWRTMRTFAETLEPDIDAPWFARFAWFELYPSAPESPPGNPTGALKVAQDPHVGHVLRAVTDMIDAKRVILTVGPYWWPAAGSAELADLAEIPRPLMRSGRRHGRIWVVGWHPTGASYRGFRPPAYASLVAAEARRIESAPWATTSTGCSPRLRPRTDRHGSAFGSDDRACRTDSPPHPCGPSYWESGRVSDERTTGSEG